jgi:hypothetical protein
LYFKFQINFILKEYPPDGAFNEGGGRPPLKSRLGGGKPPLRSRLGGGNPNEGGYILIKIISEKIIKI